MAEIQYNNQTKKSVNGFYVGEYVGSSIQDSLEQGTETGYEALESILHVGSIMQDGLGDNPTVKSDPTPPSPINLLAGFSSWLQDGAAMPEITAGANANSATLTFNALDTGFYTTVPITSEDIGKTFTLSADQSEVTAGSANYGFGYKIESPDGTDLMYYELTLPKTFTIESKHVGTVNVVIKITDWSDIQATFPLVLTVQNLSVTIT